MKKLIGIFLILILSSLAGCGDEDFKSIGLKDLGIDKSKGKLENYIDTHGSMGDGSTYIEIKFAGENAADVEKELKENDQWIKLPLSGNLKTAVYGNKNRNSLVLSFDEEIPAIPEITKGYYYFKDRHSESTDSSDDTDLFNRYSFNFDILIYDLEKHVLYIFRLDT